MNQRRKMRQKKNFKNSSISEQVMQILMRLRKRKDNLIKKGDRKEKKMQMMRMRKEW